METSLDKKDKRIVKAVSLLFREVELMETRLGLLRARPLELRLGHFYLEKWN